MGGIIRKRSPEELQALRDAFLRRDRSEALELKRYIAARDPSVLTRLQELDARNANIEEISDQLCAYTRAYNPELDLVGQAKLKLDLRVVLQKELGRYSSISGVSSP